jgi:hypothetical protein
LKVYALWHGGSSYSPSDYHDDMEAFSSIEAAREALRSRRDNGYGWQQNFEFVNRPAERSLTPAVDHTAYMDLYVTPNSEGFFARLEFGPRGGVVRSNG